MANHEANAVTVSHLQKLFSSTIQLRLDHFSARRMFLSINLLDQCTLESPSSPHC